LGVTLDACLTMDRHVTEVIRPAIIRTIHRHCVTFNHCWLTLETAKMISHGIISARLVSCNSLYHSTSVMLRGPPVPLNYVSSFIGWVVKGLLTNWHCCCTRRNRRALLPTTSLLKSHSPVRELRSSNKNLLIVPKLSFSSVDESIFRSTLRQSPPNNAGLKCP